MEDLSPYISDHADRLGWLAEAVLRLSQAIQIVADAGAVAPHLRDQLDEHLREARVLAGYRD